ncbi:MAG: hypothetical protein KGQ66_01325 [Acidobacteriota bacterium]|nr:hypothetical protein [Acidobacteriota bacterium]
MLLPRFFTDERAGGLVESGEFVIVLGASPVGIDDHLAGLLAPVTVDEGLEA